MSAAPFLLTFLQGVPYSLNTSQSEATIIKSGTRRQSVVLDSNLTWISIYFYSLRVKWLDGDESQFPCNAKANVKQAQESYGMLHQKK